MTELPSSRLEFARLCAATESQDCIKWPFSVAGNGYGVIKVGAKSMNVSRYVCALAHGLPATDGLQAAHSCGNRTCVNPHHLSWKTREENEADKVRHGTHNRGERCGAAKLNAFDVQEIRRRIHKMPQSEIAKMFGVSQSLISRIKNGHKWAYA